MHVKNSIHVCSALASLLAHAAYPLTHACASLNSLLSQGVQVSDVLQVASSQNLVELLASLRALPITALVAECSMAAPDTLGRLLGIKGVQKACEVVPPVALFHR